MKKNKQYGVKPQKFEEEFEYRDIKPADQSGDNDTDRIISNDDDESKKATDEAYMNEQQGNGTSPSSGRG
jgi:hypothetical protein